MGVATTPIGVDEHGAVVDDLDEPTAAAALLTPAHHFPHGVPLHPARRKAVVDWAHRTGGYVLEDDYDGEFRYDRQPVGAVQGSTPSGWSTSGRRARACPRRCGWAGWRCPTTWSTACSPPRAVSSSTSTPSPS